jgi:hypothetical protein
MIRKLIWSNNHNRIDIIIYTTYAFLNPGWVMSTLKEGNVLLTELKILFEGNKSTPSAPKYKSLWEKNLYQNISRFTLPMKHLMLFFLLYSYLFITLSFFINISIYLFLIINERQFCKSTHMCKFKSVKVTYIMVRREY